MLTRRDFIGSAVGGIAMTAASSNLWPADRPAWPGPIGLELYTVRKLFANDPAGTLKQVAAAGYKEVEIGPGVKPADLDRDLRAAGLSAPSGYFESPKAVEDWKKSVDQAHGYGLSFIVVGDNPTLDAEAWKHRADLYNQCGTLAKAAGLQFCYHAHFRELAKTGGTTGYNILLNRCDAKLVKMEMDVFWAMYAGVDPVPYFQRYPGRFPLLHIKDLRKGYAGSTTDDPAESGPNPFVPVGRGGIDWKRIFAHASQAGAQHIFVEQDRCDAPPLESIKISYDYLKALRLS